MSFSLNDITAILGKARTAIAVADAFGLVIPPEIAEYEAKASAFIDSVKNIEVPHTLQQASDAIEKASEAIAALGIRINMHDIVDASRTIVATEHNLVTGQAAVLAVTEGQFSDGHDKITVVAYRGRGAFADMVNQGVTDANNVAKQG